MPELAQNMIVLIITTVIFLSHLICARLALLEKRKSQDLTVCPRGKDLLELCIEANLCILNGKTFGDTLGKYTSFQYNGNGVVDYCLVSDDIIDIIFMYIIIYHT